ncbi:unnamed protein product [Owenia fusiformis]|uniref:Uncharacterized protein n=1 Tax=Owenia fusiformis TaxID=6347 RepID=A0A8J1TUB0_OWEFU|nr:unnamed protein product [Owenia fusiformis]
MATRSLTEVYILMRNNALQNRHIFLDQGNDDRASLITSSGDLEMGFSKSNRLPPEWIDGVEEIQFEITRIKLKMRDLASLHDKHLNRPTLDDSIDEEHAIEIQTQETTQMFMRCQRLVQKINSRSNQGTTQERKLSQNIVSSLARTLQELSTNFRKSQSAYLRRLKGREERSKQYFDLPGNSMGTSGLDDGPEETLFDRGFTEVQLQEVDDNTQLIQQREQEINNVVKSITELNDIFRDMASMIVDQGTILDRIDYNIESTATTVEKGLQQLQKAEKYQKKNRKMLVIVVLAVVIIVMLIILIGVKSR